MLTRFVWILIATQVFGSVSLAAAQPPRPRRQRRQDESSGSAATTTEPHADVPAVPAHDPDEDAILPFVRYYQVTPADLDICRTPEARARLEAEHPCRNASALHELCDHLIAAGPGGVGMVANEQMPECLPPTLRAMSQCLRADPRSSDCEHLLDLVANDAQTNAAINRVNRASSEEALRFMGATGGLGAADPGSIAIGLTDAILARAGEEVANTLRDAFFDRACSGSAPSEVRALLTNSCAVLDQQRDAPSLRALADALKLDLLAAPGTLVGLLGTQTGHGMLGCIGGVTTSVLLREAESDFRLSLEGLLRTLVEGPAPSSCSAADWASVQAALAQVPALLHGTVAAAAGTPEALSTANDTLQNLSVSNGADLSSLNGLLPYVARWASAIDDVRNHRGTDEALRVEVAEASADLLAQIVQLVDMPPEDEALVVELIRGAGQIAAGHYVRGLAIAISPAVVDRVVSTMSDDGAKTATRRFINVARVFASMLDAETADEVQRIITEASAPAGSWREYRRRTGALFIAGGVGVELAAEFNGGPSIGSSLGLTIPVGLEMSIWSGDVPGLIMLSVLDLGAIGTVRLDGTSGSTGNDRQALLGANFDFASIVAPSFAFGIGLGDTPLVLYAYVGFAPALRRYYSCTGGVVCAETQAVTTGRAGIVLEVDVPLFPLL